MDDKEDFAKLFMELDASSSGVSQMDLFSINPNLTGATISHAAAGNIWPYVSTGAGGTGGTGTYTLTNGTGNISPGLGLSFNDQWDFNHKQSLSVRGDAEFEGDIKLKGKSLSETLDKIEQRLAILHPNEKLEEKWEELKKLGDMYRALEKDIIEKEKIWETLKK